MKIGTLVLKRLDHLRNERLTRPALEAKQIRKFRGLLAFVRRHSPYYARLVASLGIPVERCEPRDFPVLTKREVIDHFDELVTDRRIKRQDIMDFLSRSHDPGERYLRRYHVVHTSGSSGEIGCFLYSPHDWTRGMAHWMRMYSISQRIQRIAFFGAFKCSYATALPSCSGFVWSRGWMRSTGRPRWPQSRPAGERFWRRRRWTT